MSLVFHRRTAPFGREIDENSRSLSGPGLLPRPDLRMPVVFQKPA